MSETREKVIRRLVRYYLALKISATAASPTASRFDAIVDPTPAVRQLSDQAIGEWDRRELIQDAAGREFVIHLERVPSQSIFQAN